MEEAPAPTLYAIYLGGDPAPGRLSEDHEVVLVVADGVRAARAAARAKWSGISRAHVDAVMEVSVVDGYQISLTPSTEPESTVIDMTYVPADEDQSTS